MSIDKPRSPLVNLGAAGPLSIPVLFPSFGDCPRLGRRFLAPSKPQSPAPAPAQGSVNFGKLGFLRFCSAIGVLFSEISSLLRFKIYVLSMLSLLRGFYMKGLRLNELPTGDASAPTLFTASKTSPPGALLHLFAPPFLPPARPEQILFLIQSETDHTVPPVL